MRTLRTAVVVLAAVLGTLILGATHKKARAMTTPNIVLILTDDQRWDTVGPIHGLGGNPVMPIVVSELANSGVTFTRAAVTTSLCSPSRASILTGKYAHNHGVMTNSFPDGGALVFNDSVTLGTLLQDAGYRTALIGKYLNGYDQMVPYIPPGWDEWRVFAEPNAEYYDYDLNENGTIVHYGSTPADYSTDVLTSKATSFISSSAAQGEPFMLYLSVAAPHNPFTPAPRHKGIFAGLPGWRPPSYNERNVSDKPAWLKNRPRLTPAKSAQIDQTRIDQMESLQAVDESVGAIMQALRDAGVDDNTMVIFTSDNGFFWGEHRLDGKEAPYDESMRVPMIVRYPPLAPAPRQDSSLVLNIDIFSTALELAGVSLPAGTNGVSLLPLLAGGPAPRTDFLNEHWLGIAIPPEGGIPTFSLVVRSDYYKYVEYVSKKQGTELYDLNADADPDEDPYADPYELENCTNVRLMAQTKAALAARLQALKAE